MKDAYNIRQEGAFSLTELLVVLVIIGILVAVLALPKFLSVTTRAKATEARIMLKQVHALQQSYYFEHNRFALDLVSLGFEQGRLVTEGGSANYRITLEADPSGPALAVATAVVDFDRDGVFNVWQVNQDGQVSERMPD